MKEKLKSYYKDFHELVNTVFENKKISTSYVLFIHTLLPAYMISFLFNKILIGDIILFIAIVLYVPVMKKANNIRRENKAKEVKYAE